MVITLKAISDAVGAVSLNGDAGVEISGIAYDSRNVVSGDLFVAVRGLKSDGREFIRQAVKAGAAAVLADAPIDGDPGIPVLMVENARSAMAEAAALLHGNPADRMIMVGITGTNGKTTCTFLIESILKIAGAVPGVVGTVNFRYPGATLPAPNTTPEGPDLQAILGGMYKTGVTHVVMEASSHALDLHRLDGCAYDVAAFTNLTQDHLDYHSSFEDYYSAKKLLFTRYLTGTHLESGPRAVVNIDDEWGRRLAGELGEGVTTYSLSQGADVYPSNVEADRSGIRADVHMPSGVISVRTGIIGEFNLSNLLTAVAVCHALGVDSRAVVDGLAETHGAPGRLERVGTRDDYLALVDYAHTPDALSRAVGVVRALNPSRLISVFGCGGDRDRTKRPIMGEAAARLSDLAIVTSDNPRTENPADIINDIEAGIKPLNLNRLDQSRINGSFPKGSYLVEEDRRSAIRLACRLMRPGDILIIAGKGHEDYQILGTTKIHFDDREEARAALQEEGKF